MLHSVLGQLAPAATAAKGNGAAAPLVSIVGVQMGVAVIQFNNPPVNSFSPLVAQGLAKAYKEAMENDEVKAIVLTGAGRMFMAGADIPNLQKMSKAGDRAAALKSLKEGHDLLNAMEKGSKPVVAAVHGDALGGGCEIAMGCNARVALANAKFGLPELSLGLIPGLGGTQRLPRLIGLKPAIQAMLTSKPMNAAAAHKAGLVDVLVKNPKELVQTAGALALAIANGEKPRRIALELKDKFGATDAEEAAVIIAGARVDAKKKSKGVPHPFKCLDAIEEGYKKGGAAGIEKEMQCFADCLEAPSSKALLHFFLASKATTKLPGIDLKAGKPIKSVAILGGGTMGAGIAICFLMKNIPVILKEVNEKFLEAGVKRILDDITTVVKARKMNPMVIEYMMRGLTPQLTYDNFDKVDLVIEAVIENIPLKQKIFAELEKVCSPTCVLASNTSTIDIDVISQSTKAQSRILGLHFFSPAHIMPLLEIVRTKSTSPQVLASCVNLAKTIGKTPVVVGNCVGFVANRVFFPYGMGASLLVQTGLAPEQVDAALIKFGMPMGSFRLNDSVGIDIGTHIGPIFDKAYGERTLATNLAKYMVAAGRLGQKSGKGFYKYVVPRKATPDPQGIAPILQKVRAEAPAALAAKVSAKSLSEQDIVEISLFPVVNECARTLAEGWANSAADVDIVSIMGYGFPAFRGGLMHWGAAVGWAQVAKRLQHWAQVFGAVDKQYAAFFAPSQALLDLAAGKKF